MKFNKGKRQALSLHRDNPKPPVWAGGQKAGKQLCSEGSEGLFGHHIKHEPAITQP